MPAWNIDTAHSSADFTIKHMMFAKVRGSIPNVSGTVNFDPANPGSSSVEATLEVASIVTGAEDRDNHLRSGDFFDVENYPTITFKSTKVEAKSDTQATVTGDLTIRDVTKVVVLDVEFLGTGSNPWGVDVAGFTASTKINREDFGLTWNQALEQGGVLVGKEAQIVLDIQANPVTEEAPA